MSENLKEEALKYHREGKPGKIEVVPTKPYSTQRDLSMAYTPGVAQPCLEIEKNPECAYDYTAKGNLVAVISNGTAVLGLGDIGALSGKPVMEGKGLLFKIFADWGQYTLGIYVIQTVVLEIVLAKFVSFSSSYLAIFDGFIAPVISIIVLYICLYINMLILSKGGGMATILLGVKYTKEFDSCKKK